MPSDEMIPCQADYADISLVGVDANRKCYASLHRAALLSRAVHRDINKLGGEAKQPIKGFCVVLPLTHHRATTKPSDSYC